MAREGWPFLGVALSLALVFLVASRWVPELVYGAGIFGVVGVFMAYFFRDPERLPPADPNLVLAAADGKVVGIKPIESEPHFGRDAVQISTFLSVFDVHVNRVPVSGVVDFVKWRGDRFRAAFVDAASVDNHQSVVGIQTGSALIIVKQIVGIVARRIVCRLQNGDTVERGDRFGLIRFGSRVDLILPANSEIRVAVGDRVRAGVTVMGVLGNV